MFKVRVKGSNQVVTVMHISEDDLNHITFLIFDGNEQEWRYVLADNCVPA